MTSRVAPKSKRQIALDHMWRRAGDIHREAHLLSGDDALEHKDAESRQLYLIAKAAQELASLLLEARTGKADAPKAHIPRQVPGTRDHQGVSEPRQDDGRTPCAGHVAFHLECPHCRAKNFPRSVEAA